MMAEMACKNQCNALGWDDIKPICAGVFHMVGLKADGAVVATGGNDHGRCDVGCWTNINTPKKIVTLNEILTVRNLI